MAKMMTIDGVGKYWSQNHNSPPTSFSRPPRNIFLQLQFPKQRFRRKQFVDLNRVNQDQSTAAKKRRKEQKISIISEGWIFSYTWSCVMAASEKVFLGLPIDCVLQWFWGEEESGPGSLVGERSRVPVFFSGDGRSTFSHYANANILHQN